MNSQSTTKPALLALDFNQLEARLAKILNRADSQLDRLLATCATSSSELFCETERLLGKNDVEVDYELRLGSTNLSLKELHTLKIGTILPLLNSRQGRVQIVSKDHICGSGVLLVVDGKLALRVEEINDEP